MNYKILIFSQKEELEAAVESAMADGWVLAGGVAYASPLGFMQALSRPAA